LWFRINSQTVFLFLFNSYGDSFYPSIHRHYLTNLLDDNGERQQIYELRLSQQV
jgi:hypothetical protein